MTGVAVGVDVGGTNVRAIAVGPGGEVVARSHAPTPTEDADAAIAAIAAAVRSTGGEGPVGVGLPGIITRGVLRTGANVAWRDVAFDDRLSSVLDRPVVIENDCTAGAFGEWRAGAGRGVDDVLYVGVGTGIGGGLVMGGQLQHGAHGGAGEIGHFIVEPGGEVCGCGNVGCWETVASGSAIARDGRRAVTRHPHSRIAEVSGGDPDAVTGEVVTDAAAEGDPAALGILAEVGTRLGEGIAGLVNILDPAIVVVGGGAMRAGDLLLDPARRAYAGTVQLPDPPPIEPAGLGTDAAAIGVALLALEDAS